VPVRGLEGKASLTNIAVNPSWAKGRTEEARMEAKHMERKEKKIQTQEQKSIYPSPRCDVQTAVSCMNKNIH
jgi:hypothetical protein